MHKKGSLYGITSGFFWGLDSVILGIALGLPIMLGMGINSSLITTFIHDSFSMIILLFIILKLKKVNEFKRVLFSKSGLAIVIAALLGGPIGMGAYILSINDLGASIASSISAIYPAVGLVLAYLFLKERMKPHSIVGLLIAIVAIVLMGYSSEAMTGSLGRGILFVSLCAFGWGSEAVIISATLKEDVSSEVALAIRQLTSSLTYGLVVLPIIGFANITPVLTHSNILILVLISGFLGTISYLNYYKSIDLIGATQAMGLNISYPAWAFLFQYFVDGQFTLYLFVLAIIVMMGSVMSNEKPLEVLKVFSLKKSKI